MQHIIKKQVIELQIDKSLDSFSIQQQVSNHYLQQIVPLLQIQFDSITNEDEVLVLDKLEIDIGNLSATDINNKETDNLFIKNTIEHTIEQLKKEKGFSDESFSNTKPANSYRQWFYYMQKGYLPWNVLQPSEKWYTEVLQQLATDFNSVETLRKKIIDNKTFSYRIVKEHSYTFLSQLVSIITSKNQEKLFETINEICIALNRINIADALETSLDVPDVILIWQNVLEISAVGSFKTTNEISKEILKTHIIHHQRKLSYEHINLFGEALILQPIIKKLLHEKILKPAHIISEEINNENKKSPWNENINTNKNKKEAIMKANENIEEQGIFITLAGIVLLHPFLSSLFGGLHLLEKKQFTHLQSQEKAIIVLYYLATGKSVAAEHELVIPKILAGFPIENTITKNTTLTEEEMEEADGLLIAVIAQWSILRNTSLTGLRETFLQRSGKIFTKNKEMHIQMEKSSIDILLDHLPWGLNIIKLPWVNNIIRTEWR